MTDKNSAEHREYVRAGIHARGKIRQISREELDDIKMLSSIPGRKSIAECIQAGSNEDGTVNVHVIRNLVEFLIHIDQKLDRVLEILDDGRESTSGISILETKNISGSGLNVIINASVEIGDLYHLSLNAHGFLLGKFEVFGEIMRVSHLKDNDGLFEAGIKFVNISEEERERIIAYTFSKKRQKIREIKKNSE